MVKYLHGPNEMQGRKKTLMKLNSKSPRDTNTMIMNLAFPENCNAHWAPTKFESAGYSKFYARTPFDNGVGQMTR